MHAEPQPLTVTVGAPGDLGSVALRPTPRRAPGPREIEVEVEVAALNFKDVLLALGLLGESPQGGIVLGSECAGRVVAVGSDVVAHRVGDTVVALGRGCLARYAVVPAHTAVRAPAHRALAEVVTLPTALATADHALVELGRLRRGETVLLHAAAGGVGLAALQLARRLGAEVYATAGSEAKRAFLRELGVAAVMDSRSLAFADELMRVTAGRGVDVVLNSLSGPFVARSLSVLAPGGRMVELGVRDVLADTPLGMGLFRAGVSLCVMSDRAELPDLGARLARLVGDVARGELSPLPYEVFPARETGDALRHLAGARHIGKVVIAWGDDARAPFTVPREFRRVCARVGDAPRETSSPGGIRPDEGVEVFERAIRCGWAQVVISTSPLDARLAAPAPRPTTARAAHPRPALRVEFAPPRGHVEEALAALWRDALGLDAIGVHDDFFELGGDSLLAVQVLAQARRALGVDLPPHLLVELPTIAGLAARVAPAREAETLVTLRAGDGGAPLFLLHPVGGQVYVYRDLVSRLPPTQAVIGVRARTPGDDLSDWDMPKLAAAHLRDIAAAQPRGPYLLGGSSFGGVLAYEMAQQLVARGEQVALLAMLDAPGPGCLPAMFEDDASILGYLLCQGRVGDEELTRLRALPHDTLVEHFLQRTGAQSGPPHAASVAEVRSLLRVWRANQHALWHYAPTEYPGAALFFAATEHDGVNVVQPERTWRALVRGGLDVRPVPGTHITMNQHPHVGAIAAALAPAIAAARAATPTTATRSTR